ncbi:MAG: M15 family metallopeptidase [Eubacteriales bacterium]
MARKTPVLNEHVKLSEGFTYETIPLNISVKMAGKSHKEGCALLYEDLRYVKVKHLGFDNKVHNGELVVNKSIAKDTVEIFKELYDLKYPIEKIILIDEYNADDEASMEDNNSSAFNFRVIAGTDMISKHAYGLAIDINPLYNPYFSKKGVLPLGSRHFIDRTLDLPHMINHDDICYKIFLKHGFYWGGDFEDFKDYQHFEK